MTHYGLNPSFVNGRLPLLASVIRRARRFERFGADGLPTGEPVQLGPDGYPVPGVRAGVRAFQDMGGTAPTIPEADGLTVRQNDDAAFVSWAGGPPPSSPTIMPRAGPFHAPSMAALQALRPRVLRTLDWQRTNDRTDWTRPRVTQHTPLQGDGMCVEWQAWAANALGCTLWWCATPRYELSPDEYEERLEEYLRAIKSVARRPPILEYGNELWNAGFPVHGWLMIPGYPWQRAAAYEISLLKRVADRVFGEPGVLGQRAWYLFVGGQLTVPSHLDKILGYLADLGITPDCAGPALYVGPLKAQREEWEATGAVPTQEELRSSCLYRLEDLTRGNLEGLGPLRRHKNVCQDHGVPYLACYEAGQSLIAGRHPWRAAALEAQRTEWVGELYRIIRREAEAAGVDLLCWYSACTDQEPRDPRVDVFGLLESTDLDAILPKARAARGD